MLISNSEYKEEFNRHMKKLLDLVCPGDPNGAIQVLSKFAENYDINAMYFYDDYDYKFTRAFEEFLFFNYHVDDSNFKYFDYDRFIC